MRELIYNLDIYIYFLFIMDLFLIFHFHEPRFHQIEAILFYLELRSELNDGFMSLAILQFWA